MIKASLLSMPHFADIKILIKSYAMTFPVEALGNCCCDIGMHNLFTLVFMYKHIIINKHLYCGNKLYNI